MGARTEVLAWLLALLPLGCAAAKPLQQAAPVVASPVPVVPALTCGTQGRGCLDCHDDRSREF